MSNKRMEFLIGGMVLTVFVTIIVMTILFGAPKKIFSSGGSERMTIVFDKAPGIGNNSRVLKSGVEIGRVISVDLKDDEDHSEVHVVFRLAPNVQIYTNEYARIQRTVLGDASIEFVKNPNYTGQIAVRKVEDPISGVPGGDLMGTVSNIEGDLAKAIRQVNDAAEEMTTFIAKINVLLGSAEDIEVKKSKIDDILGSLGDTLKSTSVLAGNINAIVGDENVRNSVLSSAKILPETITKIQTIVNDAYSLSDDFKYIIQNSGKTVDNVNANLDNLKSFTDSLSKEGPDFIASLTASGEDLRQMVSNINQLAEELNTAIKDSDTPIGMLRDPSIGASFRSTVQNVEAVTANANDITEGVQERIYPILDDARIFTNKIAHKPSLLLWGGNTYKGTPTILGNGKYNFQERTPNAGFASTLYRPSAAHLAAAAGRGICPKAGGGSETAPVVIDPNTYEAYADGGTYAQGGYTNERKNCLSALLGDKNRGSAEGISGIEMTGSEMIASGVEENRGACRSTPICRLADRSITRMKFSLSKLFGCKDDESIEYASDYPSDAAMYQEYPSAYLDPSIQGNIPMLYDGGVPYEGVMMSQPPVMLDGTVDYSGAQPAMMDMYGYDQGGFDQGLYDQGGCGQTGCGVEEPPRCENLPEGCSGMASDGLSYEYSGSGNLGPEPGRFDGAGDSARQGNSGFSQKDFEGIGLGGTRQDAEPLPGPYKKVERHSAEQTKHQTFKTPGADRPELSTSENQTPAPVMPSTLPEGLRQSEPEAGQGQPQATQSEAERGGFVDDGLPMLYIPNSNN